jgi:hypothetical protein
MIRIKCLYDNVGETFRKGLELEANAKLRALVTFNEAP